MLRPELTQNQAQVLTSVNKVTFPTKQLLPASRALSHALFMLDSRYNHTKKKKKWGKQQRPSPELKKSKIKNRNRAENAKSEFSFRRESKVFLEQSSPSVSAKEGGGFPGKKGVSIPGKVTGFLLLSSAAARSTPETPQRHRIHLKAAGPLLGMSEFQLFPQFPHPPGPRHCPCAGTRPGTARGDFGECSRAIPRRTEPSS